MLFIYLFWLKMRVIIRGAGTVNGGFILKPPF